MVTMGIDASTTATGVAIFDDEKLIYHDTIRPDGKDWRDRLFHQAPTLDAIIKKYKPEYACVEDVPLKPSGGLKTLVILGAVQGMVYTALASNNVQAVFVTPTTWRSRLGMFDGTKEGKKREVLKEKAVNEANRIFGLNLGWFGPNSKKSKDDEAESILICWSYIKHEKRSVRYGKKR